MIQTFRENDLKKLFVPRHDSSKGQNGQVTIIGGSKLFHGASLLSLTIASRIVDMVFFASPEKSVGAVAEKIKSKLFSFIWVPWKTVSEYIEKSDAVLIGPGLMRANKTRAITKWFLTKFSDKKWVIDAGSLQVIDPIWIPQNAILTPNKKEYEMLFSDMDPRETSKKYKCTIVLKGPVTNIYSPEGECEVTGGNAGLTKGGTGDVQAGLTVALLSKNDPFLAASSASYIIKKASSKLFEKVGVYYNADDLALIVPETLASV